MWLNCWLVYNLSDHRITRVQCPFILRCSDFAIFQSRANYFGELTVIIAAKNDESSKNKTKVETRTFLQTYK